MSGWIASVVTKYRLLIYLVDTCLIWTVCGSTEKLNKYIIEFWLHSLNRGMKIEQLFWSFWKTIDTTNFIYNIMLKNVSVILRLMKDFVALVTVTAPKH